MSSSSFLQRDLAVSEEKTLNLPLWRKILHGDSGYESGFVLSNAPVPAKNPTRFLVRRVGGRLVVYAMLSAYNKNPAKGDDPHAGPEYSGNISLVFGQKGDGSGELTVTFTEGKSPIYRRALIDGDTKSTRWPALLPLNHSFEHVFNNRGCAFESEEIFFLAVFNEKEVFSMNDTVGFNVTRVDCDANEVSAWNLAGMGVLVRTLQTPFSIKRPPVVPVAFRFRISVTNDILMVMRNRPYSPAGLAGEMRTLKAWGVHRIHWIDNDGYPAPAKSNYTKSIQQCKNLLGAACKAAKSHKLEFFADMKLFDLSYLTEEIALRGRKAIPVFDGSHCLTFSPEMTERPDIFAESHPEWRRQAKFPITSLRLFSLESIPALERADFELWESPDNLHYRPVSKRNLMVNVRKIQRENRRWTPDGFRSDAGKTACWVLELTGLRIQQPFLSLRTKRDGVGILNQQFALLEATSEEGIEAPFLLGKGLGGPMPFEPSNGSGLTRRYSFSSEGMLSGGDEPVVSFGRWSLSDLGISFVEPDSIPGMLEPTHPVAHRIWLDRIDGFLKQDVDGVSIRPLRHHRGCHSWTRYSYAPTVRKIFEKRHGRPVEPTEDDIQLVRQIRGEGFGEFLREASRRTRSCGKKFIFQLELIGGPLEAVNSRMGFSYLLKDWIEEGIFDEIHARPISGYISWMRNVLLPYAKKHGVHVHIVTTNASAGYNHADYLQNERIVSDGISLGYEGVNFYESANLYDLTEADTIHPRALGEVTLRRAAELAAGKTHGLAG